MSAVRDCSRHIQRKAARSSIRMAMNSFVLLLVQDWESEKKQGR